MRCLTVMSVPIILILSAVSALSHDPCATSRAAYQSSGPSERSAFFKHKGAIAMLEPTLRSCECRLR